MNLCLDLGGSSVKMGVADGTRLTDVVRLPLPVSLEDLDRMLDPALELVPRVDAAAVAVPGIVDAAGRRLVEVHGKYEWLLGHDVAALVSERLGGVRVVIENDARSALVGEATTGVAAGESSAAIIVLGTGVGTAALVDGVALRGPTGSAGILGGHVTVDWNGPECNCGNVGCAEVYGGTWALADRLREVADGRPVLVDPAQGFAGVFAAAQAGDPVAEAVIEQAERAWSVCALAMCHAFNPAVVVLAGGIAAAAEHVVPKIESYLDHHLWSSLPRPPVRAAVEPERSVLRGLAVLAQEAMS